MLRCLLLVLLACSCFSPVQAAHPLGKHLTRVFFQDDESKTVKWADLLAGQSLALAMPEVVEGFPKLDPATQSLAQMQIAQGKLLVAVRDNADGTIQSGWVLIDCGIETRPHGNHLDWVYARSPQVKATQLDKEQGNPPHVYVYDNQFFVTQDKRNGFTRIDPATQKSQFFSGGGGHISLAVAGDLALASWIDREGPNTGRVDLLSLSKPDLKHSITLPHGGIHGATVASNRVFFASASGIDWIDGTRADPQKPDTLAAQKIDLGQIGETPRRTGHFSTLGNHVGFVTGTGPETEFGLLDASQTPPTLTKLAVPMAAGVKPGGLELIKPRRGNAVALVFHETEGEAVGRSKLSLLELNPNGDQKWDDLRVGPEFTVGKPRIADHSGHHAIAVDSDQFRCILSNPGDGTLTVFSLNERKLIMNYTVGGVPTRVLAYGGHVH